MSIKTKYAPASLDDVVYPSAATEMRVKSLADGSLNEHVIFYGPRGTAKTTTANLLAQAIGGSTARIDSDFQNLMAMPSLKSYLQQSCFNAHLFYDSKLILLFNEFDNYKPTPYQLWDAMDTLQDKGLMLIITTNNLMAIHDSIRSRCRLIEFPAVSAIAMLCRAQFILNAEGLSLPDEQVLSYLKGYERFGDFRKYFELLDELLLIHKSGLPFPKWSGQKPTLTIVNPKKSK
jgi:DNA polymerase III delta prime subunit